MAKTLEGITIRHARSCPTHADRYAACKCKPSYQAHVWSARDGKRIRKTFPTLPAARAWRQDALPALRKGTMRAPSQVTLRRRGNMARRRARARSAIAAATSTSRASCAAMSRLCACASFPTSAHTGSASSTGSHCKTSPTDSSPGAPTRARSATPFFPLRASTVAPSTAVKSRSIRRRDSDCRPCEDV